MLSPISLAHRVRRAIDPVAAPAPLDVGRLVSWLGGVLPFGLLFSGVQVAFGAYFRDLPTILSGLSLAAFVSAVLVARWRLDRTDDPRRVGRLSGVLVVALLAMAVAQVAAVPSGASTLAAVPFLAAMLATGYAGVRAPSLVAISLLGAVAIAVVPELVPTTSAMPTAYHAVIRVTSSITVAGLGLVLLMHINGGLRHALGAAIERERETAAVLDSAVDAIVTMDELGQILSWNRQAEETFGWTAAEVIGRPLAETVVPPALREAHSAALRRAVTDATPVNVRRRLTAIRRDGATINVDVSIVRMMQAGHSVFASFIRDLSSERAAVDRLAAERDRRTELALALATLRRLETTEDTAAELCRRIVAHGDMDVAGIYRFLPSDDAVPVAMEAPPGAPVALGRPIPAEQATYLAERAASGPWVEEWSPAAGDDHGQRWLPAGLRGMIHVPIVGRLGLVGLLSGGTTESIPSDELARRMPGMLEFGALAGALLADGLEARGREEDLRNSIATVISRRSFETVFQPARDLRTGVVVGYEALTRFRDGCRPDQRFTDAAVVGLGDRLEAATLRSALQAASRLPPGAWVSVNASARFILRGRRLAGILAAADRPVLIELTEHDLVTDYAAVRRAIKGAGPNVQLAVDDAGAGYAGLRHLVELRAAYVKLDLRLVRDVDRDPARQALIAGMVHFAASSGTTLIAEGIETGAERDTLRRLGVVLGQGYLLGRPGVAETWQPEVAGLSIVRAAAG